MAYEHGIKVNVKETQLPAPVYSTAGVQVVIGTAPVNLAGAPAVNRPVLCSTIDEAIEAVGYVEDCDWSKYTLCQSIYASFDKYGVSPIVLINVLDPAVHKTSVAQKEYTITKRKCKLVDFGIIASSVTVKSSASGTALEEDKDYVQSFDGNGMVTINLLAAGTAASATSIFVAYDVLDPDLVDADDIIGGVSVDDDSESGIALVRQVYPLLGVNAGLILAPGWSQIPSVALALEAACESINGCYVSECMVDIESKTTKTRSAVKTAKDTLGVTSEHVIAYWPMIRDDGRILAMSAIMAAKTAATDTENDDVPYKSPSNSALYIDAVVLADGAEVLMDFEQGNELNEIGVCTAINRRGFYSWGNDTAAYPENAVNSKGELDPVKRRINIRRFFTWWQNNFINNFLDKVDDLANMRLVESIVDEENIRCNGYVAAGYCAGAKVEYNAEKTDAINGKIVLRQSLTPYPPAEVIMNEVEYNVSDLIAVMGGEA